MSMKEALLFLVGGIIGVFNCVTFFQYILFNEGSVPKNFKFKTITRVDFYNETLADEMFSKVKVLCLVMTHPENHQTKALYVKETWSKRCNKLLFMSSAYDPILETIVLPINDTRDFLWGKTKKSFQYVYDNHFSEADWFLKADDDS